MHIAQHLDLMIALIIGSRFHIHLPQFHIVSYLKELFHKLFENSGFQDDELFDWDTAPEKRDCEDDLAETSKEILENVEASDPQSKVVG